MRGSNIFIGSIIDSINKTLNHYYLLVGPKNPSPLKIKYWFRPCFCHIICESILSPKTCMHFTLYFIISSNRKRQAETCMHSYFLFETGIYTHTLFVLFLRFRKVSQDKPECILLFYSSTCLYTNRLVSISLVLRCVMYFLLNSTRHTHHTYDSYITLSM